MKVLLLSICISIIGLATIANSFECTSVQRESYLREIIANEWTYSRPVKYDKPMRWEDRQTYVFKITFREFSDHKDEIDVIGNIIESQCMPSGACSFEKHLRSDYVFVDDDCEELVFQNVINVNRDMPTEISKKFQLIYKDEKIIKLRKIDYEGNLTPVILQKLTSK
ncbi:MAG: hypothetical protein ABIA04_00075 [Pseudomonadota bacterium]